MSEPLKPEDAVGKALLYVFQLSNKDYRKMQRATSETAFIRALEQDGYTVIPTATLDAARAENERLTDAARIALTFVRDQPLTAARMSVESILVHALEEQP